MPAHEVQVLDDDLDLRAALPVLLPAALLEVTAHGHLAALADEAGDGLRPVAEHRAFEVGRDVLVLSRLLVALALVDCKRKVHDGVSAGRGLHVGVTDEVADERTSIDCHVQSSISLGLSGDWWGVFNNPLYQPVIGIFL